MSHIKCKFITRLENTYNAKHIITTACNPQSNHTAKTVCREVLRFMLALPSELKLTPASWPMLVPMIQNVSNSPSPKLKKMSSDAIVELIKAFANIHTNIPALSIATDESPVETPFLELVLARHFSEYAKIAFAINRRHESIRSVPTRLGTPGAKKRTN